MVKTCVQRFAFMNRRSQGKSRLAPHQTTPQNGQVIQVQQVSQSFQGPMPPPALLEHYERIVPGAAERILQIAESEVHHRHAQENAATDANIEAQRKQLDIAKQQTSSSYVSDLMGQIFGMLVSATCIGGAVYLAIHDQPWVAATLAGLPLAGIIRALRDKPKNGK